MMTLMYAKDDRLPPEAEWGATGSDAGSIFQRVGSGRLEQV